MNKKFCIFVLFFLAISSVKAQLPTPSACYTFSGNANDGSGNGHNGTVYGATLVNDRFGNANSAYSFNGVNNYITVPNFNTIISSDEVSFSFWIKAIGFQTQSAIMLSPDNTSDRCGMFMYYNQGGNAFHFWDYGDMNTNGRLTAATTFVSQWEHFICVSSQSQNFMAIYKNGALMISANHSAPLINKNKTLYIGGDSGFPFSGLIDDLAIYNEALTAGQVGLVYQAANPCDSVPAPPPSGPVACYPFSGNAIDATGNGHDGTVNGATIANDRFGNPNSAYLFNGTSSYISVPNFNTIISSDEVSFSFWIKANGFQVQSAMMLVPDDNSDRCGMFMYYNQGGNAFHFWDYGNISNNGRLIAATTYVSQWEHFVCVTSQLQNSMSIYKNGTLMFSTSHSAPLINKSKTLYIGGNSGFPFNGLIDDITIYNYALSASEIMQLYSSGEPCLSTTIPDVAMNPSSFSIYPNPSEEGVFHLHSQGASNTVYSVYNCQGKNILSGEIKENAIINLSGFPTGLYYLKLADGKNSCQKIIKL